MGADHLGWTPALPDVNTTLAVALHFPERLCGMRSAVVTYRAGERSALSLSASGHTIRGQLRHKARPQHKPSRKGSTASQCKTLHPNWG